MVDFVDLGKELLLISEQYAMILCDSFNDISTPIWRIPDQPRHGE